MSWASKAAAVRGDDRVSAAVLSRTTGTSEENGADFGCSLSREEVAEGRSRPGSRSVTVLALILIPTPCLVSGQMTIDAAIDAMVGPPAQSPGVLPRDGKSLDF